MLNWRNARTSDSVSDRSGRSRSPSPARTLAPLPELSSRARESFSPSIEAPSRTKRDHKQPLVVSSLAPIPFKRVQIRSSFWKAKERMIATATLPAIWDQLVSTRRLEYLSGNYKPGMTFQPHKYDESDVTKFVEAACYAILHDPPNANQLRDWVEEAVTQLLSFQQDNGYINAYILTVSPAGPFENIRDLHELYNLGHMLESVIAYNLLPDPSPRYLAAVMRYLNLVRTTLAPSSGTPFAGAYPGHQELEIALLRLVDSGLVPPEERAKWVEMASAFVEERGKGGKKGEEWDGQGEDDGDEAWVDLAGESFEDKIKRREGEMYFDWELRRKGGDAFHDPSWWRKPWHYAYAYMQAHLPIREQTTVEGHSVRVVYWLTAATDLARLKKDSSLMSTIETLWDDMMTKSYITGGIGSDPSTEGFSTKPYYLPNEKGKIYAETCAAIGVIFLAHRLLQVDLDSRYSDQMERALYNAVLCGISAHGTAFFYDNPLECLNNTKIKRAEWFTCSCCPPNVSRLISSLGNYIASMSHSPAKTSAVPLDVAVHLFIASEIALDFGDGGTDARLVIETDYPLEGSVRISFEGLEGREVALKLRVPGWLDGEKWKIAFNDPSRTLTLESIPSSSLKVHKGYLYLPPRSYPSSFSISLTFPLPLRPISAHPYATTNVSRLAFMRGPVVLALESGADHPGVDLRLVRVPRGGLRDAKRESVGEEQAGKGGQGEWGVRAMAERVLIGRKGVETVEQEVRLVPYATWGNRGVQDLLVWIPKAT